MVFQHFGLFPWKTVYDNVSYGLKLKGVPRSEWGDRVRPYLELVGLNGFERMYPYQLSGGMQQRAGLVRALALHPQVLLMDEPFGALDAQTRELLQEELLRIIERERKTMVFITHSIDEAIVLGDQIAVLSARPGRLRELIDVGLPASRTAEDVRLCSRYGELRQHIWEELRPEAAAAVA
jgi:NitT/TauT family transport system ATP-binding protein